MSLPFGHYHPSCESLYTHPRSPCSANSKFLRNLHEPPLYLSFTKLILALSWDAIRPLLHIHIHTRLTMCAKSLFWMPNPRYTSLLARRRIQTSM